MCLFFVRWNRPPPQNFISETKSVPILLPLATKASSKSPPLDVVFFFDDDKNGSDVRLSSSFSLCLSRRPSLFRLSPFWSSEPVASFIVTINHLPFAAPFPNRPKMSSTDLSFPRRTTTISSRTRKTRKPARRRTRKRRRCTSRARNREVRRRRPESARHQK